jgi:predicted PhzF superfamily epimerase YddE/YHI9
MENAMELPIFQLDAFATRLFGGNPAAVVILPEWLPDDVLQQIAMENNLSETAFVVPGGDAFGLRWFTPEVEVDLCGHATLASGHVLFHHGYTSSPEIVFRYQGGTLTVTREGELIAMDFPSRPPKPIRCDASLISALGATPREAHQSRDLLAVFGTQAEVEALQPDLPAIAELDTFAVMTPLRSSPRRRDRNVTSFLASSLPVPASRKTRPLVRRTARSSPTGANGWERSGFMRSSCLAASASCSARSAILE